MNDPFDKITQSLESSAEVVSSEIIKKENKLEVSNLFEDPNKDYEYTRGNLYSLIEKGQEAINGILEIAQQSDSPRAFEVAGQLIKNVADTTDKLLDLQQKMKKLKEQDPSVPKSITNNNTLFVGSTAELQKLLKQNMAPAEDSK